MFAFSPSTRHQASFTKKKQEKKMTPPEHSTFDRVHWTLQSEIVTVGCIIFASRACEQGIQRFCHTLISRSCIKFLLFKKTFEDSACRSHVNSFFSHVILFFLTYNTLLSLYIQIAYMYSGTLRGSFSAVSTPMFASRY